MSLTHARPPGAHTRPPADHSGKSAHTSPQSVASSAAGRQPALTPASAPEPSGPSSERPYAHRDRAIDLVRFACLVVVVVLHSMMSTAVLGPEGQLVPTMALAQTTGFTIASWLFQIMPLYFVIGGYAGLKGWRRAQRRGDDWRNYLRARLQRLVIPVLILVAFAGLGLFLASWIGAPHELLAEASMRIGQPLWFIAVYVGLTSLVPAAAHLHEKAPRRTVAVLVAAVFSVDALVEVTGVTGLGYLNFALVWPLVQQCGFFFADAAERPLRRGRIWTLVLLALVGLGVLVSTGVYSPNMLINLNPPTGALVLLGLVQTGLLRLGHDRLTRMGDGGALTAPGTAQRARLWERIITWGNAHGIQVYLWHMPVVIALIGLFGAIATLGSNVWPGGMDLASLALPATESPLWWFERLPWLIAVMGLAALLAMGMSQIERFATGRRGLLSEERVGTVRMDSIIPAWARWSAGTRGFAAVASAIGGIVIALLIGIAPLIWTIVSVGLLLLSLILAAGVRTAAAPAAGRAAAVDCVGTGS
ncbi:acyltransferase family protein [Brevibacterium renqingii]|uniref:acyltransferase family protein n=1 Tax=Brevibacterium renqingii TaxID=2776916 RepID=UPI001ADFFCE0|nr:acyltransferase [Brevibacterium renqingii]